jgi:hypothetical protein
LKFGSEAWALKKRKEQRLEAAQMTFLRHLLGITKLDKEKKQCIREEREQRNKTVPGKVAYNTYRGWTQTGYLNKHYNANQNDEET